MVVGEEHLRCDSATEFWSVGRDMVLNGCGLGELFSEDGDEAGDRGGGFREALRVVGIFFSGLVRESAASGAGGDVSR